MTVATQGESSTSHGCLSPSCWALNVAFLQQAAWVSGLRAGRNVALACEGGRVNGEGRCWEPEAVCAAAAAEAGHVIVLKLTASEQRAAQRLQAMYVQE